MLHRENFVAANGTDMTVLERQRAIFSRQQPQHNYVIENKPIESYQMPQFHGLIDDKLVIREMSSRPMKADQCFDNILPNLGDCRLAGTEFSLNSSCSMAATVVAVEKGGGSALTEQTTASTIGRESLKKRKAEFVIAQDCKDERIETEAGEGESEVTAKSIKETSDDTSKENSKVSEVQKPDYIHVRARRGQATDSHSLAERARREKISKKMKCLQDLVPGCDKVTGKAGMLDEIINYVQSLQRQVEFLSMKLANLNPRLDFNMENFFAKEFPAHVASFPTAATPSEMANLAYLQAQQGATSCVIDMPINPNQMAPQRTTSSSMSIPEAYLDSCFPQIQPLPTWETDLQSFYNAEFH